MAAANDPSSAAIASSAPVRVIGQQHRGIVVVVYSVPLQLQVAAELVHVVELAVQDRLEATLTK